MNILQDIKTAAKVFGEIREARKSGAGEIQVKAVCIVPCFTLKPAYVNTIEGSLRNRLGSDADRAVMEAFEGFPYETQRWLESSEPGTWVERARFWQRELKPVLPPKMYYSVMTVFIQWYIHCLRQSKES